MSLEYMKIYEKEQMLIEEGIELGRQEAEIQFEEERHKFIKQQQQAEEEHQKLLQAEEEIHKLRKALAELSSASTPNEP